MLYFYIFLAIIALTISELTLYVLLRKQHKIARFFEGGYSLFTLRWFFLLSSAVSASALVFLLIQLTIPKPLQTSPLPQFSLPEDVELVGYANLPAEEKFYYVYLLHDKSFITVQYVITHVRDTVCKKQCIINFYDTQTAYILDRQRESLSDHEMAIWNKENYIYVADHYLGYLSSQGNSGFAYYPYQDTYYMSLKGK